MVSEEWLNTRNTFILIILIICFIKRKKRKKSKSMKIWKVLKMPLMVSLIFRISAYTPIKLLVNCEPSKFSSLHLSLILKNYANNPQTATITQKLSRFNDDFCNCLNVFNSYWKITFLLLFFFFGYYNFKEKGTDSKLILLEI